MLNSEPIEIVVTINFLKGHGYESFNAWLDYITKRLKVDHFYVHWPSLMKWQKNSYVRHDDITNTLVDLWEINVLRAIPGTEELAELPAILYLNNAIHPDNVRVYCGTFEEYIELRKHFGKEDVRY